MRIGILGGTFDPPHNGHLALARAAIAALDLDEVIFLTANRNPGKKRPGQTPPKERLEMVKLLVNDEPKLASSDAEITRGGTSYAVDTLAEMQMAHAADYWFIVGTDAFKAFSTWKQPERLLRLCRIAVAARPGTGIEFVARYYPEQRERIDIIEMPPQGDSSTEIRERIAKGLSVVHSLPPAVLQYVRNKGLYKLG